MPFGPGTPGKPYREGNNKQLSVQLFPASSRTQQHCLAASHHITEIKADLSDDASQTAFDGMKPCTCERAKSSPVPLFPHTNRGGKLKLVHATWSKDNEVIFHSTSKVLLKNASLFIYHIFLCLPGEYSAREGLFSNVH